MDATTANNFSQLDAAGSVASTAPVFAGHTTMLRQPALAFRDVR